MGLHSFIQECIIKRLFIKHCQFKLFNVNNNKNNNNSHNNNIKCAIFYLTVTTALMRMKRKFSCFVFIHSLYCQLVFLYDNVSAFLIPSHHASVKSVTRKVTKCVFTAVCVQCCVCSLLCACALLCVHCCVCSLLCVCTAVCVHCCVCALLCVCTAVCVHCCVCSMLCVCTAVCVHCCVCALLCVCTWMGKCRAQIPSMGHHTWLYVTSLFFNLTQKMTILTSFTYLHVIQKPHLFLPYRKGFVCRTFALLV